MATRAAPQNTNEKARQDRSSAPSSCAIGKASIAKGLRFGSDLGNIYRFAGKMGRSCSACSAIGPAVVAIRARKTRVDGHLPTGDWRVFRKNNIGRSLCCPLCLGSRLNMSTPKRSSFLYLARRGFLISFRAHDFIQLPRKGALPWLITGLGSEGMSLPTIPGIPSLAMVSFPNPGIESLSPQKGGARYT